MSKLTRRIVKRVSGTSLLSWLSYIFQGATQLVRNYVLINFTPRMNGVKHIIKSAPFGTATRHSKLLHNMHLKHWLHFQFWRRQLVQPRSGQSFEQDLYNFNPPDGSTTHTESRLSQNVPICLERILQPERENTQSSVLICLERTLCTARKRK